MPNTLHVDYELKTHDETVKIVEEAMASARQVIPQGTVADYIPELGKADPEKLGICIYPLQGDMISLGDCNERFTMQSISKVFSLSAKRPRNKLPQRSIPLDSSWGDKLPQTNYPRGRLFLKTSTPPPDKA